MTPTLFFVVLLSAVMHASWNIAAKRASGNLAVIWLGQVVAAAAVAPAAIYFARGDAFTSQVLWLLALTGVTQAVYFTLLSKAYAFGDISVVYPIARGVNVAGVAIVATLAFGEDLSSRGLLGILAVGGGTICLGLGRFHREHVKALVLALAIGAVLTFGSGIDKMAMGFLHPVTYIFFMFFLASIAAMPLIVKGGWEPIRLAARGYKRTILLVGCGSMASYVIILFAIRVGNLAYIAALRECSVLLGALWGYLMLKERFTWRRGLGMLLILAGLVSIRFA